MKKLLIIAALALCSGCTLSVETGLGSIKYGNENFRGLTVERVNEVRLGDGTHRQSKTGVTTGATKD